MIGACPRCKNRRFKKTIDTPYPTNTYATRHYPDKNGRITHRYKQCVQCGHKWITEEVFLREIETEPGLFDGN